MNYHAEDAVELWQRIQDSIRVRGHDRTFESLSETDHDLLRLTLVLAVSATGTVPR